MSAAIRALFWIGLFVASLGTLNIDVRYRDGIEIHLEGWPRALARWRQSRRAHGR